MNHKSKFEPNDAETLSFGCSKQSRAGDTLHIISSLVQ